MARSITWLPRLHLITRAVGNSVRSHYDRKDLEKLFELQPRAAQKLLEMLPTAQVGSSRLVDREVLANFLEAVLKTEDLAALCKQLRDEKTAASKRRPRSLVRRDLDPIGLESLPSSISLEPGLLQIRFESVEQLAEAMYALARVLEAEGDQLAKTFEPVRGDRSSET